MLRKMRKILSEISLHTGVKDRDELAHSALPVTQNR